MQKTKSLQVKIWNRVAGYLAVDGSGTITFEFDKEFKGSQWDIAPIEMPLASTTLYRSKEVSNTFSRLPGVIADCLPDRFGMTVINGFFKKEYDLDPPQIGALDRLFYIGERAIGALEFIPAFDAQHGIGDYLDLQKLLQATRKTLEGHADKVAAELLRVSASPGGRHAKALVDYDPKNQELRAGFAKKKKGFIPCILKLDGASAGDPPDVYGRLEYVYSLMAKNCGLDIPQTYLLKGESEGGAVAHFLVERFDRNQDKYKNVHYGSLCGLLIRDFQIKHSCSYDEYLKLTLKLTEDLSQVEEALRRVVFNIVFRNQDDHTKNLGFVMDRYGTWRLAPAFDLTYVYGVGVSSTHQMTLAGKDDGFTSVDIFRASDKAGINKKKVKEIMERIGTVAEEFPIIALEHGLEEPFSAGIKSRFRTLL